MNDENHWLPTWFTFLTAEKREMIRQKTEKTINYLREKFKEDNNVKENINTTGNG